MTWIDLSAALLRARVNFIASFLILTGVFFNLEVAKSIVFLNLLEIVVSRRLFNQGLFTRSYLREVNSSAKISALMRI